MSARTPPDVSDRGHAGSAGSASGIPDPTVQAFARTIHHEATKYGFRQIDMVRLINVLLDLSTETTPRPPQAPDASRSEPSECRAFPLASRQLRIRFADPHSDAGLLEGWMQDEYGKHFLISCATAQRLDVDSLLSNPSNQVGIIELASGTPIGAVAYLDVDELQKRAELRKIIGDRGARGQGYAEEATALWIEYGLRQLGLEKICVSTLQTHLRNIKLNESVGFRVEGVLRGEVLMDGERHDILRMGLCSR